MYYNEVLKLKKKYPKLIQIYALPWQNILKENNKGIHQGL